MVVLALWEVLRAAAGLSPALLSMVDQDFIEACVRVHNELRAKVQPAASNMRYMVGTGPGGGGGGVGGSRAPPGGVGEWAGGLLVVPR